MSDVKPVLEFMTAPRAVCKAEIVPAMWVHLPRWPSPWARFWHWVFFGIRWEAA